MVAKLSNVIQLHTMAIMKGYEYTHTVGREVISTMKTEVETILFFPMVGT